jgi:sigma-54 dependent transcriptional regulator, acetoin dehydrogenase operon transcriptional activator AcoR
MTIVAILNSCSHSLFNVTYSNTMKTPNNIESARQEFLSRGRLTTGQVAEAIERSWRRCLSNGLDSNAPQAPVIITAEALAQRQSDNQLLIAHAEPEMATLSEQIAHTRSMVILTDHQGVILKSIGDQSFVTEAQRVSLSPGASWSEADRGTNAIGTALIEQSAISVQGAEHFMTHHHVLSCSAVPIFGARNELLATLDVSNDYQMPQQHTLALVKMAAQMVENRLFKASFDADIIVHFHSRSEFIGTLWEGIAIFNESGEFIATNRSGQFQLNLDVNELNTHAITLHFNQLFETSLQTFRNQSVETLNLISPAYLMNGARVYVRIEFANQKLSSQSVQRKPKTFTPISAANLDLLNNGDPQVALAIRQIKQVLNRKIPILIQGETGVGKDLLSRAIHDASASSAGPWVAVNCAALPEGLIEAELFGYEEGAFTGARKKGSVGKLVQANGGTLFLDEIGDMPLSLQARLLRVLQDRTVTPLGSTQSIAVDFSLISATNQKLKDKVALGEFRSDLYYRLNGLSVLLPALRERTDMAEVIKVILQIEQATNVVISSEVMSLFVAHPWPGNIRQLHNVMRTATALSDGKAITLQHLTQDFLDEIQYERQNQLHNADLRHTETKALNQVTDALIRQAMLKHDGNISAVARVLGISRNTLYRKLKLLDLA